MAIPIRSVPTLYGEDAARFLSRVEAAEAAAQQCGESQRAISRERMRSYLQEMNML